jgi:proprotein convertase subtilisin/kexin type 5
LINYCAKYAYVDYKGKALAKWFDGCRAVCIECKTGYFLNKGMCIALPPNCEAVDAKGKCTNCSEGYELNDGKCIVMTPPTDNCAKYGYIDVKGKWFHKWVYGCKKVCKECVDGFYLNTDNECVALPGNCAAADVNGMCTECVEGYKVKNGKCVKIVVVVPPPVVDNCLEYGYADAKGKHYTKWIYGCKKVCKKCVDGFYLNTDNECVALPGNCAAADVNGMCTECVEGYKVKNGKCVKIVVVVPPPVVDNCLEYKYVDTKGKHYTKWVNGCKKVCILCREGYDLVDGKCVPCEEDNGNVENDNPYCVERNEDGDCCKCAYRTYKDKNGICTPVSDYCETWNERTGVCTCCYTGYTLVKGDCVLAK